MKGQSLPITGTGEETRDFSYVLDLMQGLIKAGFYQEAVGENFNLAAGKEIAIKDMAKLVNEVTGNSTDLEYKPRRKWDTKPRLLASIDKAQKLIKYHPLVEFKDGFLKNIEWFKDNWDIITNMADFSPGMSSAVRNGKK
jgi:nucleoside-diphosphate-sugar epimerase